MKVKWPKMNMGKLKLPKPKFDKQHVTAFLKKHWYLITMSMILFIGLIVYIAMFFEKSGHIDNDDDKCEYNSKNVISDFEIANEPSDNSCAINSNFCESGLAKVSIISEGEEKNINSDFKDNKAPCSQFCTFTKSRICDDDPIYTDIKVVDMTNEKDASKWKDLDDRCPKGYYPAFTTQVVNSEEGKIRVDRPGCKKMGICIKQDIYGNIKDSKQPYITQDGLKISMVDKGKLPDCPKGYIVDKIDDKYVNIHGGCNTGKDVYLCKQYTHN